MSFSLRGELGLTKYTNERKLLLVNGAKKAVKEASFAVERRLKGTGGEGPTIPVDTGRARASWGHFTPGDLRKENPDAGGGDAVWEDDREFEITQGSNVEYIGDLDEGCSQQAPGGFTAPALEAGQRELDKLIDALMRAF